MRRVHLFEFEDLPWFPASIRSCMTDFLSYAGQLSGGSYRGFVGRLHQAMVSCGERRLVDLCSGGGGPATTIARLLRDEHAYPVDLLLTDLYPSLAQWERVQRTSGVSVRFEAEPVDATRVRPGLGGFRLICNGFHHLRPADARAVLLDAVEQHQGIAVFEAIDPGPSGVLQPFVLTAMMQALTPFIRPFRWSRLFYTYVLPAAPLFLLWDGLVSWGRIYSPDDLRELLGSLPPPAPRPAYTWEIGQYRLPGTTLRNTFLIGTPQSAPGG